MIQNLNYPFWLHRFLFFGISNLVLLATWSYTNHYSWAAFFLVSFLYCPPFLKTVSLDLIFKIFLLLPISFLPQNLALIALLLFITFCAYKNKSIKDFKLNSIIFVFPFLMVISLWLIAFVWGISPVDSPLYMSRILQKTINTDALFHASLYNSFYFFNTPSTLVNGLDYIPYHFGSHFYFSRIGKILNVPGITFYQIYYFPIILPLFLSTLIDLGMILNKHFHNNEFKIKTLAFMFFFFFGFLPPETQKMSGFFRSEFISESCALAFVYASLLLGYFFETDIHRKNKLKWREVSIFSIILFAIGITKISTFFVISAGFLLYFIAYKKYKSVSHLALAVLTFFILLFLVWASIGNQSSEISYQPFSYFKDYVNRSFYYVYAMPLMLTLYALRNNKPVMGIVLLTTVVAFIPSILFYLLAGNAYYFLVVPFPFLCILSAYSISNFKPFDWKGSDLLITVTILILLINNSIYGLKKFYKESNFEIHAISDSVGFIRKLENIRSDHPEINFKKTIVFIPKNDHRYWNYFSDEPDRRSPFLLPALSGVAGYANFAIPSKWMDIDDLQRYLKSKGYLNRPISKKEISLNEAAGGFTNVLELSEIIN